MRGAPRRKTFAIRRFTRDMIAAEWVELGGRPESSDQPERPRTWGECTHARPCPWVACRHHLYLDVNPATGAITFNHPNLEPHELKHSCSLDVADLGGQTLEQVGDHLNVTRERVRQLELRAILGKLKPRMLALGPQAVDAKH